MKPNRRPLRPRYMLRMRNVKLLFYFSGLNGSPNIVWQYHRFIRMKIYQVLLQNTVTPTLALWMFPVLASGWRYFTGWTLRTPQLFSPQDEEGCCHAECLSHTLVWAFRQRLLPFYSQVHHLWQHYIKRGPFRHSYMREDIQVALQLLCYSSGDTWLNNVG